MPPLNFDDDPIGRSGGQWQRAMSGLGAGIIMIVIVVVIFAGGYWVMHQGKRPAVHQSQMDAPGGSGKAKPSPAIPFGSKPKVAPPPVLAALPAESVPAAITEAATPGAARIVVKAKDTEGIYAAKHQKIFGRGCDGHLELTATALNFACGSGTEGSLHFVAAQIKGVNGNGVELKTGEKFHFDLRRGKAEEQEIFRNWVYTHVPGAYAARD